MESQGRAAPAHGMMQGTEMFPSPTLSPGKRSFLHCA